MTDVHKIIKLDSAGAAHGAHDSADPWHHHGAEEGAPQEEHLAQVNAFALIKWLVIIIVIVVVTVWGLAKLTGIVTDSLEREDALKVTQSMINPSNEKSRANLQAAGESELAKPAHSLPAGGVAIPIDTAMSKVLSKYEKGRSLEKSLPPSHAAIK